MQMRKRITIGLVICLALLIGLTSTGFGATGSGITRGQIVLTVGSEQMQVNGVNYLIDKQGGVQPTVIGSGYTMLPLRAIVEAMGGEVIWNETNESITMILNNEVISVSTGTPILYLNGDEKTMPVAPYIDDGRTMIWIRALEYFEGITCSWSNNAQGGVYQIFVNYSFGIAGTGSGTTSTGGDLELTFNNKSGKRIDELYMAKTNTAAAWNSAEDLLRRNLSNRDSTIIYDIDLEGTRDWYFRAVDSSGVAYTGAVTFTDTAAEVATLTLNAASNNSFSVSRRSTSNDSLDLTFRNRSGVVIEELYMSQNDNSSSWRNAEDILGETIENGEEIIIHDLDLNDTKYWYFRAVDDDDNTYTGEVTFGSTSLISARLTLTDDDDDAFTLSKQENEYDDDEDTKLTFRNRSGVRIDELYMAESDSSSAWRNAEDLLSDTVADSDSETFYVYLDGERTWYFMAVDRNDNEYVGRVTFISRDMESARITLTDNDDDSFSLSSQVSR